MDKQRTLIFAVAGIVLVGAIYFATSHGAAPEASADVVWTDYTTGSTAAHTSNKKMLIDIYTDWCTWCKTMEKKTYADPEIAKYLHEHFVTVKLNAESKDMRTVQGSQMSEADLAQAFGATGYPTTVFVGSDGKPITSMDGYVEPGEFKYVLHFIAEEKYRTMTFEQFKKAGL